LIRLLNAFGFYNIIKYRSYYVLTSYITSELINPEGIYDILSDLNGLNDKIKEKGKIIVK